MYTLIWELALYLIYREQQNILTMKATSTKTTDLVKSIDRQLRAILKKDIRKIEDANVRQAAFLQLIAA